MKDKELKKELIEKGAWEEYSKQRFSMRKKGLFEECEDYKNYTLFDRPMMPEEFIALQQIGKARKEQREKIRHWITYYLNEKVNGNDIGIYFGTFTYKDKDKETNAENLKRKIIRTISPNVIDYIINVDYGKENERLHYHAILIVKDSKENKIIKVKRQNHKGKWRNGEKLETPWLKNYEKNVGIYDLEPVKDNERSINQLSNYVNKLVMHSIKVKQAYISTKKGTKYQRYKEILKIIRKPIKDRNEIEIDKIRYFMDIESKIDNFKHFRDIVKYLKLPKNFDGTSQQLEFWNEENQRRELKGIKKTDVFEDITEKDIEKDKQIYELKQRLKE